MTRRGAYLAAAWAIAFAAPHVYWATGRTEGLDTALSDRIVDDAGLGMALGCAGIALFCLCGASCALATVRSWPAHRQRLARRALGGLVWFGALLLVARGRSPTPLIDIRSAVLERVQRGVDHEELGRDQGTMSSLPVVRRPSRSR